MAESKVKSREVETPCGKLAIGVSNGYVRYCDWVGGRNEAANREKASRAEDASGISDDEVLNEACKQVSEYFEGRRTSFRLPLSAVGTQLGHEVWDELRRLPYGHTVTYKELARRIGRPEAVRAVASAVAANPLVVIPPCHRVVRSDGGLGGYSGPRGVEMKRELLDLERSHN